MPLLLHVFQICVEHKKPPSPPPQQHIQTGAGEWDRGGVG